MFNVADNFHSSSRKLFIFRTFLCLLKSSQTSGIKIAGGKKQPTFWLQYALVGAEPGPVACSHSDRHEWNVVQHRIAGAHRVQFIELSCWLYVLLCP